MDATTAMTETEALDEALLRFLRKTRRALRALDSSAYESDAFNALWAQLPDGAKTALHAAEMRADTHRNTVVASPRDLVWPAEADDDQDDQDEDCEGHADGPVMGETFYCDGSCRPAA